MRILVTGTAGFIGFHLAKLLLEEGFEVHGYDGLTDYYDVNLKKRRHEILCSNPKFTKTIAMLEDHNSVDDAFDQFQPDMVVHLAAQAGVRYSLENPRVYLNSNVIGAFNVMDSSKRSGVKHLLMASTSSVYGANETMPFSELQKCDDQLTIYAATKKANESMAHSYAHLWDLPITMFRFFTVYGPWGRPDMALFKFVENTLKDQPIDIYNNGKMSRDFTYVDDLVSAIRGLLDCVPKKGEGLTSVADSLSKVAPYRVVNIGNSDQVSLMDFISAIECAIGKESIKNFMPMQMGDVPATHADTSLLHELTGYKPSTHFTVGIEKFVAWYLDYYTKPKI